MSWPDHLDRCSTIDARRRQPPVFSRLPGTPARETGGCRRGPEPADWRRRTRATRRRRGRVQAARRRERRAWPLPPAVARPAAGREPTSNTSERLRPIGRDRSPSHRPSFAAERPRPRTVPERARGTRSRPRRKPVLFRGIVPRKAQAKTEATRKDTEPAVASTTGYAASAGPRQVVEKPRPEFGTENSEPGTMNR